MYDDLDVYSGVVDYLAARSTVGWHGCYTTVEPVKGVSRVAVMKWVAIVMVVEYRGSDADDEKFWLSRRKRR